MRWALNQLGERILAIPKQKAKCPLCFEEVGSKCGRIKIWHWSHKKRIECDLFGEPETEWHLEWKDCFPKEYQEVVIKNHRADIKFSDGEVLEFQNSALSLKKIKERESFYGNMIWVLNGKTIGKGIDIRFKEDKGIYTFRWKNPPKSWWESERKIFIDLNEYKEWSYFKERYSLPYRNKVFLIKKIYPNIPCGGWGTMISKEEFINGRRS